MFMLGFLVGGAVGILLMAVLTVAGQGSRHEEQAARWLRQDGKTPGPGEGPTRAPAARGR